MTHGNDGKYRTYLNLFVVMSFQNWIHINDVQIQSYNLL